MSAPHLTTLLLLDFPPSTFFGIDFFSFTTSPSTPNPPSFRGIKLIPRGLHELYYSPGPHSDFTPRTSIWFTATGTPGSVIILKWDRATERVLDETSIPRGEVDRIKAEWWRWWMGGMLVEYRSRGGGGVETVADAGLWREMTAEMGEETLDRVLGAGKKVGSGGERVWRVDSAAVAGQDRDDEGIVGGKEGDGMVGGGEEEEEGEEGKLSLLPIDLKRTFPPNATGRERTLAATDRSWYLNHLITTHLSSSPHTPDPGREYLAELQLTFLLALTLSNLSASLGWKRLLTIALTCETRILTHPTFYARLLTILTSQLGKGLDCFCSAEEEEETGTYLPEFLSENSPASFDIQRLLRGFLRTLRRIQQDLPPPAPEHRNVEKLLGMYAHLETLVESKFGWTLDASKVVKRGMVQLEDGEMVELDLAGLIGEEEEEEGDAPVVVEL